MKTLKNFEKDLSKCSKCGQCQIACPIYKLTRNECTASRGKFMMLHGVTQGELELSPKINTYLDMCLKCGKCSKYCPAGIDVIEIFNYAKYQYMKNKLSGKIINFLQSRLIFSNIINAGKLLFNKKRNIIVGNESEKKLKLVYFKGCVNQVMPNTGKYLNKILKNTDIEIITPDFDCCGLPFLSEGNLERFEQTAQYNIKQLDCKYDFIVTDCASCEDTLLSYNKYFKCNINTEKSLNWGDIIALKNIKFKFDKQLKVTFHKPCHLKNDSFFERIMDNCSNIEYIKMNDYDECCGFAGSFAIKNRNLSKKLSKNKALNIQKTNADYVITSCPACILGLKQGLRLIGNKKTKVISLLEFLSKAEI